MSLGISLGIDEPRGGTQSIPQWVLGYSFGNPASVDLNFASGLYYQSGVGTGAAPSTFITTTRASSGTNLLPTSASGFVFTTYGNNVARVSAGIGLIVEESRTNQLLNSTAPVTQTTGALANTAQALWVNGSGSAVLSNGSATGCTGTATQGTPVIFTPTAGTCSVTVTGSLNAFQLEAGSFPTSLIVTAGVTATRATDVVKLTTVPAINPILVSSFASGTPASPASNGTSQTLLSLSDGANSNYAATETRITATGNAQARSRANGGSNFFTDSGVVWAQNAFGKLAANASSGTAQALAFNGTSVTAANAVSPTGLTSVAIGQNGQTSTFWNGTIARVAVWPTTALTTAQLRGITQ